MSTPLRHVLGHLVIPLLMCAGMGFAYLGAFTVPEPHDLPVAVVDAPDLARSLQDRAGDALDVRTATSRDEAVELLKDREITGAYLPAGGRDGSGPELLIASAGSDMSATAAQQVFTPVATERGAPLRVTDIVPPVDDDPTGSGLFFLMIAVSIGSYGSVAVLGAAGAALRMRVRAALVAGVSLAVSLIGTAFAGPLFHLVHHGLWGVWAMSWLYSAGILFIGTGLHTFLKRWTTLTVMALFVMLNFTSSGGLFRPELQNGFFGALHSFWNGAGFVEGLRGLVYFDGLDLARNAAVLTAWLATGLALVTAAALTEHHRTRRHTPAETAHRRAANEEEMEESTHKHQPLPLRRRAHVVICARGAPPQVPPAPPSAAPETTPGTTARRHHRSGPRQRRPAERPPHGSPHSTAPTPEPPAGPGTPSGARRSSARGRDRRTPDPPPARPSSGPPRPGAAARPGEADFPPCRRPDTGCSAAPRPR